MDQLRNQLNCTGSFLHCVPDDLIASQEFAAQMSQVNEEVTEAAQVVRLLLAHLDLDLDHLRKEKKGATVRRHNGSLQT